jgi:cardiolipin synthase A/B
MAVMALRDFLRRGQRWLPFPYVQGNRVQILNDGGAYFSALLEAIYSAKKSILLETYILVADRTGWRIAEALSAQAQRGVEVVVCYDGYGSFTLDSRLVKQLRDAGAKTLVFRPVSITKGVWPWSKRNHRKSLIVDSRIGIVGGQNISDDYAAPEDGGKGWRDTGVRVEGPAVAQLESMFRSMWMRYGGLPITSMPEVIEPFPEGHQVRFLGNFARRDRAFIRRQYLLAILGAEKSIRICNAYFVPDRVLRRALIRAARRGVNVEILIGAATDVFWVLHVSRGLYAKFLRHGIRVYEWHDRVLHAKTAVIDGVFATIGSSNFDNLSFYTNLEVNATIMGERIGRLMDIQFESDVSKSTAIHLDLWKRRPLLQRVAERFFSLFRRLV